MPRRHAGHLPDQPGAARAHDGRADLGGAGLHLADPPFTFAIRSRTSPAGVDSVLGRPPFRWFVRASVRSCGAAPITAFSSSPPKTAFAEVAAAQERTAAQLLRVLMRDAVQGWRASQEHDAWFRNEVEQGLREADDPAIGRLAHDRALSSWQQQRAELERRAAGRTA